MRLRQILFNLLSNAGKFTKQGEVALRVKRVDDAGSWIEFAVSDTGIGMTTEQKARLFEEFTQLHSSAGGTGLGLHIIFNLVTQQLGGRLAFESRLGWGTRFRITLPRVAPGESPPAQAAQ